MHFPPGLLKLAAAGRYLGIVYDGVVMLAELRTEHGRQVTRSFGARVRSRRTKVFHGPFNWSFLHELLSCW
jgi:hypothetical protein